jgi:hypothetical protein
VVLDREGIVEQGSHEELIARDGWYAGMARLQSVGTEAPIGSARPNSVMARWARVG